VSGFLVAKLTIQRGDEFRTVLVGAYVTSGPIDAHDPETGEDVELTPAEKRLAASMLGTEWGKLMAKKVG
jgi:hypothetical protein